MQIIAGLAELALALWIIRISTPVFHPLLNCRAIIITPIIAVHDIGIGGDDDADRRTRMTQRGGNKERNKVRLLPTAQAHGIVAAFKILRDFKSEIIFPSTIVTIIFMKMNGCIVLRRMTPAHFVPPPTHASHAPGRHVHQSSVKSIRANI